MTVAPPIPADTLAPLADTATQRVAAQMAQDVFAGAFRQSIEADSDASARIMAEVEQRCFNWSQAGDSEDARALRLALLIGGLDQWGLAYSRAFNLTAIPALTALIGALRTRLDAPTEARFQRYFEQLDVREGDAIDFKVALRRNIHLALWHAMAACESAEQANTVGQTLGSLLVALHEQMPEMGWRLLADALATIQIALLGTTEANTIAQDSTQNLFEALRNTLPPARYQAILAHAGQAVMAWQSARRSTDNTVH